MRTQLLLGLGLSLATLGACKWTEFDDLRDDAWVRATTKPDGSKSTNWGVALIRGKATSASGGTLAVFGTASSRLNEIQFEPNGDAKNLDEQNLGDIGIGNLSNEPIVIADPSKDDFSLVTQGSAQQVVVAAGVDSQLFQKIINGASTVDAAAYIVAPQLDSDPQRAATRPAQPPQPLVASGDTLFGTFFDETNFQQTSCQIVIGGSPVQIRAIGALPNATLGTDDVVVWTDQGDLVVLDGHVFNGGRSGTAGNLLCDGAGAVAGVLTTNAIVGTPSPTGFIPEQGTIAQIMVFGDHFAILQGHSGQDGFLALWDFTSATGTAGAIVGTALMEPGLRAAALYDDGNPTNLAVVAGFPNAVVDGVTSGQVLVHHVDTATGVDAAALETLHDAQPDDGQAFGRAVAVLPFNGTPVISIAGNNEVYTYFRTPRLYNSDTRQ